MRILLFGATGMIGQGALRECLRDPEVTSVQSVVRRPSGSVHPKLRETLHGDFSDFTALLPEWEGLDACLWCLGVSAAGLGEAEYRRVTYDSALAAAEPLARLNPGMRFVFISGAGADSSEGGRTMWARVKGATENALLRLPFQAFVVRPAGIQPLHGIRSRTPVYRVFYLVLAPLLPLLRKAFPAWLTTTEELGRALLRIAKEGSPKRVLEAADIPGLGRPGPGSAAG
ncbi:MAG: epimerase [Acidobacteria bacterium]|nr:epimerase [Acidobacteriota bacterium]